MTACLSGKCTVLINFSVAPQMRHSRLELPLISPIFSALNISISRPPRCGTTDLGHGRLVPANQSQRSNQGQLSCGALSQSTGCNGPELGHLALPCRCFSQ